MNKTIKIDNEVYKELDNIRVKGETFSAVVYRLLLLHKQERTMLKDLGGKREEHLC